VFAEVAFARKRGSNQSEGGMYCRIAEHQLFCVFGAVGCALDALV
jgi:hypothetical protein